MLMGYALLAAVEGRQQLAVPAERLVTSGKGTSHEVPKRSGRVIESRIAARASDKAIVKAPIVVREGGAEVVRPENFALVRMALASNYKIRDDYPRFDPYAMFSNPGNTELPEARMSAIYSADAGSQITLRSTVMPNLRGVYDDADEMSTGEIEQDIRSNGALLASTDLRLGNTLRIDPQRFADTTEIDPDITGSLAARIIDQNVSTASMEFLDPGTLEYADDILPSGDTQKISSLLIANGYDDGSAAGIEEALAPRVGENELRTGDMLRVGILQAGEMARIVRFTLYRGGRHVVTLAVNDRQKVVSGVEPPMTDAIRTALKEPGTTFAPAGENPTVYDGIYRAALSYGLTREMAAQVLRLVGAKADLQATTRTDDKLEAFFSAADEDGKATENSELLYVRTRFGDVVTSFYRFQDPETGAVDYFDSEGKGIRPLLLRMPVAKARLTSNFGQRIDPILGYVKGHSGTDLAAPQGTPIIAAGDGVVERAGWASSYGNQTVIRHGNGYVSSYSHQSGIAKGVKAGTSVTQGQVIGFVGSTGRSTGPHLHYELTVNGTRVDAMRARVPQAKDLTGKYYEQFKIHSARIDGLLESTVE